jgi:hypothetical protein
LRSSLSFRGSTLAVAALSTALLALGGAGSAEAAATSSATTGTAATSTAATSTFTCSHQLARGRIYTLQTVTGSLTGTVPTAVSVIDYHGAVVRSAPRPTLDPAFWSGYFATTYHLNAWDLGQNATLHYHLLVPQTAPGTAFTAMLYTEFTAGGNWQNWMPCTLS